jgi:hypothetical protein
LRSFQVETNKFPRNIDSGSQPETSGTDLIERNSADGTWQTDGSADFTPPSTALAAS